MELVDMKRSPAEMKAAVPEPAREEYPYGLRICLQKEDLDKLGITGLPEVGDEIIIHATACVCSVSMSANDGGDYKSVDLQIESMALEGEALEEEKVESEQGESAAHALYGKDE